MLANTIQLSAIDRGAQFRQPAFYIKRAIAWPGEDGIATGAPQEDPDLIPEVLSWRCNGELSTLTIKRRLSRGAGISQEHPESMGWPVPMGMAVLLYSGVDLLHFVGHVAQRRITIQANPDFENYSLTAYGPELRLDNKVVSGQWHKLASIDDAEIAAGAGSTTAAQRTWGTTTGFRSDLPVIFNEDGKPNASQSYWWINTDNTQVIDAGCRVFEAPDRKIVRGTQTRIQATHWTAYRALRTLIELIDGYDVISPATNWQTIQRILSDPTLAADGSALEILAGEVPIGTVNVEGKSLLQAIHDVLIPVGFGFALDPRPDVVEDEDGLSYCRHKLIVFPLHPVYRTYAEAGQSPILQQTPVGYPYLAQTSVSGVRTSITDEEGQRGEVQRIDFLQDAHNVKNQVTVKGMPKKWQIVLSGDLDPVWDTAATWYSLANWDGTGADEHTVDMGLLLGTGNYTAENFENMFDVKGKDHAKHPLALRAFAWNEDAVASTITAPDLASTTYLGMSVTTGEHVRRPRAPGRTLSKVATSSTTDYAAPDADKTHPATVEFAIATLSGGTVTVDEDSWIDVSKEVKVDPERTMILVTRDTISDWFPWEDAANLDLQATYGSYSYLTLLHNLIRGATGVYRLQIRLTATWDSDLCLKATKTKRGDSTWPFVSEAVRHDPRYQYRHVEDVWKVGMEEDERDDTTDIGQAAERAQDAMEDAMGHASIVLRGCTRAYPVGMAIPRTEGRVVWLCVDAGTQFYAPVVVGMTWDMREDANKTELQLDSPLLGLPS